MTAVSSFGCTTPADESPPLKITTKRDNDRVEITAENDSTVLLVHSPFGISQALIERTGRKWPDVVMLRLHLRGLESLEISNGEITLRAAASSQDGEQPVRLWKDGQEEVPLDSQSPYWMEVEMIGVDGQLTTVVPLKDGYFEIVLPKALFEGNPKSVTINWIDFYR